MRRVPRRGSALVRPPNGHWAAAISVLAFTANGSSASSSWMSLSMRARKISRLACGLPVISCEACAASARLPASRAQRRTSQYATNARRPRSSHRRACFRSASRSSRPNWRFRAEVMVHRRMKRSTDSPLTAPSTSVSRGLAPRRSKHRHTCVRAPRGSCSSFRSASAL